MAIIRARHRRAVMTSKDPSAFPSRQLFVLALCRIAEPIAFMSIFPYIYYMVRSFNITQDERQLAVYAGMVTSAFAFAEFSAGVFWGRMSDKVGRKPILLTGLAGTGLSMLVFGFAPNLPVALLARALGGVLNGNIGVLQTTVAEVVTVEAHQPRAFSIMPFVWCLGSIIGAGLGGTLAEPVKGYPSVFQANSIWDKFPYLLPNLVCAAVVLFGLVIGILFLEETHEDKKDLPDFGLEVGDWIISKFSDREPELGLEKSGFLEEAVSFLNNGEQIPEYQSTDFSTSLRGAISPISDMPAHSLDAKSEDLQHKSLWSQAFTPQVILIVVGYGILAFHTISLEQLLPVLFSMPESDAPPQLPFKFVGGFALPTKTIGYILSFQGFLQMIAQIFLFPWISQKFGSLRTFRVVIYAYPLLYFIIPYLTLLPKSLRFPGILLVLVWKVTAQSLAYPSIAIMLANSAPSKKLLGTINGVAASAASLSRAFGPTLSGAIQSEGLNIGYAGLSWWVCALVAVIGATESLWWKEVPRKSAHSDASCVIEDEEASRPRTEPRLDPSG